MSLSQKHTGKVLVPWYNSLEWRTVYNMLCSGDQNNYSKALSVLKIWKLRTPLLSAGVEGTLIVLEAILMNRESLTDFQLNQIYAIALMRFLNICATSNEKQGTFYRTAIKNDLPKWLISIRHDIAHDHRLPSGSMLELGLNQSLKWLKMKYWEVQKEIISDYVVTEEAENAKIMELLNIYIRLNISLHFRTGLCECDETFIDKINKLLSKKYRISKMDMESTLRILEEILKQSMAKPECSVLRRNILKIIASDKALLSTNCEYFEENEIIPRDFRDIWSNLLNILFESKLLFSLLNELLDVTKNLLRGDDHIQKVASLWIREVFQGLRKLQSIKNELNSIAANGHHKLDATTSIIVLKSMLDKSNPELKNYLEFDSLDYLSESDTEVELFKRNALISPNVYTLNYLEEVLKFEKNTDTHTDVTINLVRILTGTNMGWNEEILTTDLAIISSEVVDDLVNVDQTTEAENVLLEANPPTTRWTLIQDTASYQGCPLGILPHQNRTKNPLVFFE